MAQISKFNRDETVRLDTDRLVVLYAELGQTGAERVIAAAMEDLAVQLVAVEAAMREARPEDLERAVEVLDPLARQVGLVALAKVAGDLLRCVREGDSVAQASVRARLTRLGERSLTAVWELADRRG